MSQIVRADALAVWDVTQARSSLAGSPHVRRNWSSSHHSWTSNVGADLVQVVLRCVTGGDCHKQELRDREVVYVHGNEEAVEAAGAAALHTRCTARVQGDKSVDWKEV